MYIHTSVPVFLPGSLSIVSVMGPRWSRGYNYMPFAVMSLCILILMHILPEDSEAPVTYTVYFSHTQVWWSTCCHRGQTQLISCHRLWTSSLFSFPPFAQNTIMPLCGVIHRGTLLLNVILHMGSSQRVALIQPSERHRNPSQQNLQIVWSCL